MPELPEVETTRRHLEAAVVGRRIVSAEIRHPRLARRQDRPADFSDRIAGRLVLRIDRIGKLLMKRLDGEVTWVTHLGMSGRVRLVAAGDAEEPHTNVVVRLDDGNEFRLVDPRTFGFVVALLPGEPGEGAWTSLGPDALDALPTSPRLARRLAGRSAPIKALLLDQGFLAGLGNIYADEVLFRAGVSPHRPGGSLSRDEVARIRAAIRPVLRAGLRHGGTSLADLAYLLPDGRAGDYLSRLKVYGRAGDPCRRCGDEIIRTVVRGRSTHWCPRCQT